MIDEYADYASEIREIEDILSLIPEKNVLERISFEARLKSAKDALEKLNGERKRLPKVKLTFRGKPVLKSHGIFADFAAKATRHFSNAYAKVAAGINKTLSPSGPIPDYEKNQLVITGTAIGSFGFEFELPTKNLPLLPETEDVDQAISLIEKLFQASAEGSDDEIADVVENMAPRAVSGIHDFMAYLVKQGAWCGLEYGRIEYRYQSREQLENACNRLKRDKIQETLVPFSGIFQGVLPDARTFEFKPADADVIRGKIDAAVSDPAEINRLYLAKQVEVVFARIQIGVARPRYFLRSLDTIKINEHAS